MFGDEGKGSIVDFLAAHDKSQLVCRFNGGAQARHHVVDGGREHGFAQFGSATFLGVPTLLSRYVMVTPTAMQVEAKHLVEIGMDEKKLWSGMFIDERARIVTPYHRALNRLRELCRRDARHGSCGMGIGESVSDYIQFPDDTIEARDIKENQCIEGLLERCRARCLNTVKHLDGIDEVTKTPVGKREMTTFDVEIETVVDLWLGWARLVNIIGAKEAGQMLKCGSVIFEGAQGVLLDECYGFHPYTTWSNCTQRNAIALCQEVPLPFDPKVVGVVRPYTTRHGPGPFPTFSRKLTETLQDKHNVTSDFQGPFRVGRFDLVAMNYAFECCKKGVGMLAVTNMDRIVGMDESNVCFCDSYGDVTLKVPTCLKDQAQQTKLVEKAVPSYKPLEEMGASVMASSGIPLSIMSFGPTRLDKTFSTSAVRDFIKGLTETQSFAA